jgi:hypothetical protein
MTHLEWLEKNPNATLQELKNAFPNDDAAKVESNYKGFQNTKKTTSGTDSPKPKRNLLEKGIGTLEEALKTQEAGKSFSSLQQEMIGVSDAFGLFYDSASGKLKDLSSIAGGLVDIIRKSLGEYFEQQTALLEKVNAEAGLTGQLSKDFREEVTKANPRLLQLGISFGELAESATKLVTQTGRFALINQQTFERAGEIAAAYVGNLQDLVAMYPEFEKVGLGAADAQEKISEAGNRSLQLGLRAQTTTLELSRSIGKLNEYGFKNGINGLSDMVRKATEFRMSMEETFKIAEKVMSPEGAIDLSANLQVLGGAIGDFNDPLKLMYMATNNVEGLQDALIGAAGGLATYNTEQGRFEITGVNLRRAKAMADSLGISYQELSKGAIAAAERGSAAGELLSRGLRLDEDQQRFITNLAQMKGGQMTIELQSEFLKEKFGKNEIALKDLDENQARLLMQYQDEFKQLSENDIVRNQATAIENIKRDVNFVAAYLRLQGGRTAEAAGNIAGFDLKSIAKETQEMGRNSVEWLGEMETMLKNKFNIDLKMKTADVRFGDASGNMTLEKQKELENKKKQEAQTQQQPQKTVVEHQLTLKHTQPVMDAVERSMTSSQSIWNDVLTRQEGSFLYPYTSQ